MEAADRFEDLLRAWQDGDATADELRELEGLLRGDPARRRRLADAVLVESALYGKFAREAAPAAPRRRRWLELAAAGLLVAASAVAVGRLMLVERPAPAPVYAVAIRAERDEERDWTKLLRRTTIDLPEAVARALAATPGVPVKAELKQEDGRAAYAVLVSTDQGVRRVEIDGEKGTVLKTRAVDAKDVDLPGPGAPGLMEGLSKALERLPGRAVEVEFGRGGVEAEIWAVGKVYEVTVERRASP